MHDLTEGVTRFRRDVYPAKAELFAHLAATHRPETLFISCSDARVVPELITQSEPGELFVIRTAGNLVPPYADGPDGVAAGIEYALAVLGVTDIVVCGHSACGAMTALAERHDLSTAPAIAHWLRHAAPSPGSDVDALVRENPVARALAAGSVTLHAWVYDIATGTVEELDPAGPCPALAG
ncbi:carbonic anhydrase [Streptomyces sp. NPDC091268]|uniref:carbonic anhydrase n=1 Tax=Streptomyces sp. NPDC091268 TaxID=3365979 RepID=UPI003828B1F1